MTYHGSVDETLKGVRRLMQEGHAHAVKMEGGVEIADTVKAVVRTGSGTHRTDTAIGESDRGYRIQGKDAADARRLMDEAKALEAAGAFGIVLELVTEEVARAISEELSIPTIGIGAGRGCDGQVLVFHDVVQYALHAETLCQNIRRCGYADS